MKDRSHTPGPWEVASNFVRTKVYVDESGLLRGGFGIVKADFLNERREADMQLIAATPDLLAACEASLSRIEDLESRGNHTASTVKSQLVAAIAKAKGLQS